MIFCNINIYYPPSDTKLLIALITRIAHDYIFLVTFVFAAQIYLSQKKDNFNFSLKFKKEKVNNKKVLKIIIISVFSLIFLICAYLGTSNLKAFIFEGGKWIVCGNQKEFRNYRPGICLLNNEEILIVGGVDTKFEGVNSAEIFNPKTKKYKSLGKLPLTKKIGEMTATIEKLNDGNVVILTNSEKILYNPLTDKFKNVSEESFYQSYYPQFFNDGTCISIDREYNSETKKFNAYLSKINQKENTKIKLQQFRNDFDYGYFKFKVYRFGDEIVYCYYKSNNDKNIRFENVYYSEIYNTKENTLSEGSLNNFKANCVIFLDKENILYFSKDKQERLCVKEYNLLTKSSTEVKNETVFRNILETNLYINLNNGNILFIGNGGKPYSFLYERKDKKLIPIKPTPCKISKYVTKQNLIKLQNGDIYIQNPGYKNLIYHCK